MLNPEEGGSPLKYRGYEDNIFEAQETKSLTKGKLLHLYMLEPENYHVLKVPKPSGKLGELIEEFYKEMKTPTFSPTTTVIEGKEQEVQDIIKAYNKICTSLYGWPVNHRFNVFGIFINHCCIDPYRKGGSQYSFGNRNNENT